MWSLPDINSLNARAAAGAESLKRQARSKRKRKCEYWKCETRAVRSYLIYDIFSNDPKGVLHLCDDHDGYSGAPAEGYFTCEDCQRVIVDHYTWERYRIEYDGASLCLKCAAERYFADQDHWLNPRQVKEVVLEPGAPRFDRATGTLNLAACRHVLGVKGCAPFGITTGSTIDGIGLLNHICRGGESKTKNWSHQAPALTKFLQRILQGFLARCLGLRPPRFGGS
jgi:hypothetical protein